MKKNRDLVLLLLLIISTTSVFFSWSLYKKVHAIAKESSALYKEILPEKRNLEKEQQVIATWDPSLCKSLKVLSCAEDLGILKSVKKINIDGVVAPYNASILEDDTGYLMVFRYDIKERKKFAGLTTPFRQKIPFPSQKMPFRTFIGAIRLDKEFNQISPVQKIDTGSDFSEDPRIFNAEGKLYLSYNDMQENDVYSRSMRLAELDPKTLQPLFVSDIDQHISCTEKNWVPFTRKEASGEERIYFGYGINPHKIMGMQNPKSNQMDHPIFPHTIAFQKMPWKEKKWGVLRGGTPARLVNGQYLAFFHTLFYEAKRPWYAMGAYTFEANPPYRVTAVSASPILFKGIYDTPAINTAHSKKKAIYPAGMAFGKEEGKDVIYLSCGENDSAVKILTFDTETLLQSLTPVVPYQADSK
ncbi:MAG: hypothetical protein V4489_04530 [Chlamydiota bacterium]